MRGFGPTCVPIAALLRRGWIALGLVCCCLVSFGAEPSTPVLPIVRADETNAQEALRSWLQVQEQLHATQLAIERNRQESDAAAARSAEVLGTRLQGIEQALAAQRAQELEAMQSSNRVMLIVAGSFAALGLVAMLLAAFFQWRTVSKLAEVAASLPLGHAFGMGPAMGALGAGDGHQLALGPAQESNQRLLGALDKLEQRILELEHTARPPLKDGAPPAPQKALLPQSSGTDAVSTETDAAARTPEAARITMLLGKGQTLLNLDQAEEALACFDELLALDPNHPEALVKKGAALERLRKLDEAVACYDRAIAADGSLTVAYLYKAGLFNRMERFNEALECYEKALRTQEARRG
jgi:tetratricopeptide (TPR) repeat protein